MPEHAQLSVLSNFLQIGELQRMTQFKEKSSELEITGILTYPILMTSDILIHKTNEVPG